MLLNRNLKVPCGCARNVISGPSRNTLPLPSAASTPAVPGRTAIGDEHAAFLGELLQLRYRARHGDAAQMRAVLFRHVLRCGGASAKPAAAAVGLGNAAVGEEDDVVLRLEVA